MDKQKNKKIIIVVSIAIVSAIIAGILLFAFLTPQRTTVYVFKENYKAGTMLSGDMLTPIQVDSTIMTAGASNRTSSCFITRDTYSTVVQVNDALKVDVDKGTPLMASMLTSTAGNDVEVRMSATSVAVTVPVTSITGVTADIKPESHINVYVTYNSGETHLILENIRVLATISGNDGLSGLTLELDNDKATKVIAATNTGTIYCGLVNGDGYQYETQQ